MGQLMNTKEVAAYLGIHEKKVYYLVKTGKIPCTRVTGKWVFPKNLIDQWIEQSAGGPTRRRGEAERPFLLAAGSDDPSLSILRELHTSRLTPTSLFLAPVGSSAGLAAIRDGVADLALAHLLDPATGEYNLPYLRNTLPSGAAAVPLFYRELGLVARPGNPLGVRTVADLARTGLRIINRQKGSGTRLYLDQQLSRLGIDPNQITGYEQVVATHLEVGLKVLRGEADAGVATRAAARMVGLDFTPLTRERFDMIIAKERFFSRGVQVLLEIVGSREFRTRVEALGGYDTSESGRIIAPDLAPGKETS
ncbi:MAG: substrate-binding domain-containing protein [candidate division NC10 bacterium]|jgi:excisionase family DNA binding protein|nr:helix-turn-helix domain-containing protein [candidate division NC10 bacterium]MCZ6551635.1 helix-turn-helix domain-containing protein [candidate division NC10 bacterium]